MPVSEENRKNAEYARKLYVEGADPLGEATDWAASLRQIRLQVEAALTASNDLRDLRSALEVDGGHMLIFRHLLAPPKSQDQFKLLCDAWSKSSEKSGNPQNPEAAKAVSEVLAEWMDRKIAPWLAANRGPTEVERELLIERVISFIAPKLTETQKRNRLSAEQEKAVVQLLLMLGWVQLPRAFQTSTESLGIPFRFEF